MEKRELTIEVKNRISEILGDTRAHQIIDVIDSVMKDDSLDANQKINGIHRVKLQVKYRVKEKFKFNDGEYLISEEKRKNLVDYCDLRIDELRLDQVPIFQTKSERIRASLKGYGFLNLELVANVDETELLKLISTNKLSYQIAMLDHLKFLLHLKKQFGYTGNKINILLAEVLESNSRDVKGEISSLSEKSKERERGRYKAYQHKETVKIDYNSLK